MSHSVRDHETQATYQSVKSIATYMAAMLKIIWNHEYYDTTIEHLRDKEERQYTHIISQSRLLIITLFPDNLILIILVI